MKKFLFKQKFCESLPKSFSKTLLALSLGLILLGIFAPFPKVPKHQSVPLALHFTEHYARFIPTILSVAIPLIQRDAIGL
ncbi:lipid A 1-phosphatase domain protein, partial [Helicobacter pylori GAMchJs117Ai]